MIRKPLRLGLILLLGSASSVHAAWARSLADNGYPAWKWAAEVDQGRPWAYRPPRDEAADHERARRALEAGRVLPLSQVLEDLRRRVEGDVIGVELEREDGRFVYELTLIRPSGQIHEAVIDAESGTLLELEVED